MDVHMIKNEISDWIFWRMACAGMLNSMNDKEYLERLHFHFTHEKMDFNNPKLFNEKIHWLKMYDRKDIYTQLVDKIQVKKYVADKIGKKYVIPIISTYDNADEIVFEELPKQFVIKCNHNSGEGAVICKDKDLLDIKKVRRNLNRALKKNYYFARREWPYKNVKPKILVEKYMKDDLWEELLDYKIYCFNGEPKYIKVDIDRFTNHTTNIYSLDWNLLPVTIVFPNNQDICISKPEKLEEMLQLARMLSVGIPLVRMDFYIINNQVYFGEFTLHPGAGVSKISPREFEEELGKLICLPDKIIQ